MPVLRYRFPHHADFVRTMPRANDVAICLETVGRSTKTRPMRSSGGLSSDHGAIQRRDARAEIVSDPTWPHL
jgi:hypothetical protein